LTIQTFYRLAVWLPLALPGVAAVVRAAFGPSVFPEPLKPIVGWLLGSLVYGGIPYALLALWATVRMGRLDEPEIRRLMFRAPFLMIGMFTLVWFVAGLSVGQPQFILLGPLAAFLIIPAGYGYMGFVLLIREQIGTRLR
jgi:hypothetical protein